MQLHHRRRRQKKKKWSCLLLHRPTPRMSPSDRSPARHATVGASLRSEASLKYGLPHCLGPQGSRSPASQASVRATAEKSFALGIELGGSYGLRGGGLALVRAFSRLTITAKNFLPVLQIYG